MNERRWKIQQNNNKLNKKKTVIHPHTKYKHYNFSLLTSILTDKIIAYFIRLKKQQLYTRIIYIAFHSVTIYLSLKARVYFFFIYILFLYFSNSRASSFCNISENVWREIFLLLLLLLLLIRIFFRGIRKKKSVRKFVRIYTFSWIMLNGKDELNWCMYSVRFWSVCSVTYLCYTYTSSYTEYDMFKKGSFLMG